MPTMIHCWHFFLLFIIKNVLFITKNGTLVGEVVSDCKTFYIFVRRRMCEFFETNNYKNNYYYEQEILFDSIP